MNLIPPKRVSQGFTIAELLISTGIILLTSLAILFGYVQCLELNAINKETLIALDAARNTVENVKSTSFEVLYSTYNQKTAPIEGLRDGLVLTTIDSKNPLLLGVTVKCFWRNKNRVVGEDKNLNGQLDLYEDANNNGTLDSPVSFYTAISQR